MLPHKPVIGWIGTGVMGRWMFSHLLDKGFAGRVYNRTREKAAPLVEKGALWCNHPAEVSQNCQVIFTMVGIPNDVSELYLAPNGLIETALPGTLLVDMTTSSPALAAEIHKAAIVNKLRAIDAPVSGGDVGAKNATLSVMVGGDLPDFEDIRPFLDILGSKVVYQGSAGAGQHAKMCNQIAIAGTMIGVCESLLYGYRAGLDPETLLSSISGGAAACWSLDNLAPKIIRGNFEPGFYVRHFVKDLGLALEEARRMKLSLPGLALAQQLYLSACALGYEEKGTQALFLALKRMAGMPNP